MPQARLTHVPDLKELGVKYWLFTIVGVVLAIAGVIWALQGFGEIGGSFMSGDSVWAVIGPVAAVVGLALAVVGLLRLRAQGRAE